MSESLTIRDKQRRILRTVRRLVWLGVLGGIAFFCLKYDIDTIPADYDHLAPQHMRAGSSVVSTGFDADDVQVGNVVLYRAPGHDDGWCYGVIAGLPREAVIVEETRPGAGILTVGDRREQLPLPPGHRLRSGVIPESHFLILNGDRNFAADVLIPDSRIFGYVPAERITKRLIIALNPLQ